MSLRERITTQGFISDSPQRRPITDRVTPLIQNLSPRIPTDTATLVRANAATQLVGGLMLATGKFTRPAALVLAGTLVPATAVFDIDVIMLFSYDQSQFKDTGALSIAYWTLIGAHFLKGEKNDTHTLMDAALFHIPSRQMLLRASGVNHLKNSATPINLSEQAREDSLNGFRQASMDLTKNLQASLYNFRKEIRSQSGKFKLKLKPCYELEP